MLRVISSTTISLCGLIAASLPALAHFQEILPSADVLPDGGDVTLTMTFTHPFEGGPVMEMKKPVHVGVLRDGKQTDVTADISETPVDGKSAWTLKQSLPEPGAAVFFVEPQPYWEPAENRFIVHYAKVVVDSYASGEGWDALIGLPVEIQPLTRPTGIWAGSSFSGIVLKNGHPLPFAEIEIELVNDGSVQAPNDAFITQVVKADANGTFTYAMPHAGWWGFAALTQADQTMTSPDGKQVPVEEGGLIWVKATDIGQR